MKMKTTLLIIAALLFSYSPILQAQGVSYNQEFQVNTYTDSRQRHPSVSSLMDGGFVVCWTSYDQDGHGYGIYGQLFNSDGSRRGTEFQVNTYTQDGQNSPCVSSLMDGRFVVCWNSWQDGSGYGIYGQLFDSDGFRRGGEFQVNTYTYNSQLYPSVSSLIDGGFVVCWQSYEQDGSYSGIYGQLFDSERSRRGDEFQVNTYTQEDQYNPIVSSLMDGGFVVCWQSDEQDGSYSGIYGQLFDSEGSRRGAEFQVNTYTRLYQRYPSVSSLMDRGFVVCWESSIQDGSVYGIYGQLFDSNGSRWGDEFQVNTYTQEGQFNPSVSSLIDGGFVVCWESGGQDGSYSGIYGQLFDNDGSRRGAEFQVNTYTNDDQNYPSVSSLTDGGFVVCWTSNGQDGSGYGIYGKYYLKEINHQLTPFSLLEPTHDSTIKTISPSFKWRQASSMRLNLPWELEYHLYLDQEQDFSSPHIFPAIYDTTCTVDSLTPGTTYFWKVLAKNIEGDNVWSSNINGFFVSREATTICETPIQKPTSFQLFTNYPNPFNPQTTIKYFLPMDKASYDVKIIIYDVLGQLVVVLKDEQQIQGVYTVKWDGQNAAGQAMPSGAYICVLQAGQFTAMQKMLLVR